MGIPYIWSYSGLQRQGLLPATQGLSEKFHQIFWHFDGNSPRKKSFVDNSIKTLEIFHLKEEWPHTCVSPRSQPPSANTSMETWDSQAEKQIAPPRHHCGLILLITACRHIPTMTKSHHGGNVSVFIKVGMCQCQNLAIHDKVQLGPVGSDKLFNMPPVL